MSANETDEHPYITFLVTVDNLVKEAIEQSCKGPEKELLESANKFAGSVLTVLRGKDAESAVLSAFANLRGEPREALCAELEYFNQKYGNQPLTIGRENLGRALEDAGTVKDSIEALLKKSLPGWVKKMMKILNELLSLIRPV